MIGTRRDTERQETSEEEERCRGKKKRKNSANKTHCKLDTSTYFVLPTSLGRRIVQIQSQLPLRRRFVERGNDRASGRPGRTDDGNTQTTTIDELTMTDIKRLMGTGIHGNRIRKRRARNDVECKIRAF
jgi:hypothetical protein